MLPVESTALLTWLTTLSPWVTTALAVLGGLVILGQTYVALTPTQKDDAWWAKMEATPLVGWILKGVRSFSPIQRKEK